MSVHRFSVVEPATGTLGTHAFRVVQGTGVPVELTVTIEGEGGGGGAVDSVNGQTGVVVLDAADVGAATAAQGATADSAVQPGDLATVATTGAYADLTGKPTLGTAAAAATGDFATAAQGAKADTAVQPADLTAYATDADITALIGAAPAALNTLSELADALGDDANFASTVTTALAGKQPLDADLTTLAAAGNSAVLAATTAAFTTADETKLDGIAAGAEVNVQSDWNAGSGDAHILNKPTLGTAAAAATTDFATAAQGTLADSAVQPGDLATVATSGAYGDLSGTPTLATVATTGDYDDLTDKPTIPTHLRTIHTDANATLTLSASHLYGYLRCTNASPDVTVPDDGDVTWPVGGWVEIFAPAGPITFIEDTSVTINVAAGQSLIGEDAGSMFYLIKVAAQTWDLAGRLAS